jgi:hypothetical protein
VLQHTIDERIGWMYAAIGYTVERDLTKFKPTITIDSAARVVRTTWTTATRQRFRRHRSGPDSKESTGTRCATPSRRGQFRTA